MNKIFQPSRAGPVARVEEQGEAVMQVQVPARPELVAAIEDLRAEIKNAIENPSMSISGVRKKIKTAQNACSNGWHIVNLETYRAVADVQLRWDHFVFYRKTARRAESGITPQHIVAARENLENDLDAMCATVLAVVR